MNNGIFENGKEKKSGNQNAKREFSIIGFACAILLIINYGGTAGILFLYRRLAESGALPSGLFAPGSASLLILEAVLGYLIALPAASLLVRKTISGTVPAGNAAGPLTASGFELFCIAFFLAFAGSAFGDLIEGWFAKTEGISPSPVPDGAAGAVLYFVILCILIPVSEELFFRSVLGEALIAYGDVPAILIPALLSAFYHGNLTSFFVAFLEGMALGYVYVRTRRLIYPVLLRFALNLIAGFIPAVVVRWIGDIDALNELMGKFAEAFQSLSASTEPFNALLPELESSLSRIIVTELLNGLLAGIAFAGFILFMSYFGKLRLSRGTRRLEGKEIGDTVFLAPGIMLFLVLSITVIALSYSSFSADWFI
ncbi:MAG: CPBP family intramembrane metalloprotease [Clostridia bacterium]|nr:CPBP family intramembrane metalloprotease [Clostridia bacterium]